MGEAGGSCFSLPFPPVLPAAPLRVAPLIFVLQLLGTIAISELCPSFPGPPMQSGCKVGGQAGVVDQVGLSQVSLALHAPHWCICGSFPCSPSPGWSAFCFLSTAEPKSRGVFIAKEAKGHLFML